VIVVRDHSSRFTPEEHFAWEELASVKLTFPIDQVYEDVVFPPESVTES
jgi:hypothetical protein